MQKGSMETNCQSSCRQALWKDVEMGKEQKKRCRRCQLGALVLILVLLSFTLCIFVFKYFLNPSNGKVYSHQYKVVLDGVETDSVMEINPAQHMEVFRMGNSSDEVLEVHDFKNGLTGIRFAKHQRCYIKTQDTELPKLTKTEAEAEDSGIRLHLNGNEDIQVDDTLDTEESDSQVWIPAEEPIADLSFLQNSKIRDVCQHLPIHWIHPLSTKDADFHDMDEGQQAQDSVSMEVRGHRQTRDVTDEQPVNDYREAGIELDNRLDERGYCCQNCLRGHRHCQRYHEPLGGFSPYPYYYQGGRVICQIIMPCNWWIARMLGRI
ncbi:hypothetical protein AGOR_G00215260 [Albula goreensis]|uniref:BRICHOS domain-containing protein n=1 Tax=Albula goreensis TaxID=1534307 RepID=A0A8T3CIN7_9TELE|nr:hypothetical protein AGOR_G00215260 [Albula goreensis]